MDDVRILVVDDEKNARLTLKMLLEEDGYTVELASDGAEALQMVEQFAPSIILTDLRMPNMDGLSLLDALKRRAYEGLVIVMTAFASIETAVKAMKAGAYDYLTKPLNYDAVEVVLKRAMHHLSLLNEVHTLRRQVDGRRKHMLGQSETMKVLNRLIEQVASSRATVLISGESGTGKELVARQLHTWSEHASAPFVALHCAALPDTLLEDELFGHEKGAFTGAAGARPGCFERAEGGTLFLDEIGEISLATQVKFLRVLQERSVRRLGGSKDIDVNVRLICATNRNLQEEVREGRFREDLYYRLNVIQIPTPPLRARRSDIIPLAQHFMNQYASDNNKMLVEMSDAFKAQLMAHDWPGNVRELENAIERAVVLAHNDQTVLDTLYMNTDVMHAAMAETKDEQIRIPGSTLADIERHVILSTYDACDQDTKRTAEMLGISRRKVQYSLKRYGDDAN